MLWFSELLQKKAEFFASVTKYKQFKNISLIELTKPKIVIDICFLTVEFPQCLKFY